LITCETVRRPFAEVRAAAVKAYEKRLVAQTTNVFKFAGGGGDAPLWGRFWNGSRLTLLPQQSNTLLIWQSRDKPVVADRLNSYLREALWKFSGEHRDYWRTVQPERPCHFFGIAGPSFAPFSTCFVSSVDPEAFSSGNLYFKLASSPDESLTAGVYYSISWGTTCGSVLTGPYQTKPQ